MDGAVRTSWQRRTPGTSSTTATDPSGNRRVVPLSTNGRARVSLVRPSTRSSGSGLPQSQGSGGEEHPDTQVVAGHRLDPVGRVGQQHGVAELPGGHAAQTGIDGLEDRPVGVGVQPAAAAVIGHPRELRDAVGVPYRATERRCDPLPGRRAQLFPTGQ